MKNSLVIILPLLLIVGCSKEPINYEKLLVERNNKFYTKDTNKPYTGVVFSLYDDGKKKQEGTVKDGKSNGVWTVWYKNGNKKYERIYKNGRKHGLWTWWYENGQKKTKGYWKEGKLISEKEWNENGSIKD